MKRLLVVVLLAAGCGDDVTAPGADGGADASVGDLGGADLAGGANAARGEYLVKHLLICGDCHTTPDGTGAPSTNPKQFLAGGRAFAIPGLGPDGGVGQVFAPNLTPDATGVGAWSASNLVDAVTVGIDKDGNPLFPIMPYYMFANLTPDDAMSIALYLKSLPPASNPVAMNTVPVLPQAAPAIDAAQVPRTTLPSSDPAFASAQRGRYLAEVSCIECHTRRRPFGSPTVLDMTKAFAGGEKFPLGPITTISANLTPDATGLASWSAADIKATLKTDLARGTGAQLCPPMPGGADRLGGLTDGDLTDLASYVHTLPPIANGPFGCDDAGVPFGLDGGP